MLDQLGFGTREKMTNENMEKTDEKRECENEKSSVIKTYKDHVSR